MARMKIVGIATSVVAIVIGGAAAWAAGQGASVFAPGQNKEFLESFYDGTGSPTPGGEVSNLGGAISGGYYGNTSNAGIDVDAPDSGHGVTPSISPGPQTVPAPVPGTGSSIGDVIQGFHNP